MKTIFGVRQGPFVNPSEIPEDKLVHEPTMLTIAGDRKAGIVYLFPSTTPLKDCPCLGSMTQKKDKEKTFYCTHHAVIKTIRYVGKNFHIARCCSTLPKDKYDANDDTRDCKLG